MVTRALSRDVALPHGAGTGVLITLDNGKDHTRPTTLGPAGLGELNAALDAAQAREDIAAIMITGKPFILAAGADLSFISSITKREHALAIARIGHAVYDKLHTSPVPTFAFINGMALGGGLELTLHCHYRTVSAAAAGLALPECFLGMFPGWGGAYLVPNLIGAERAVTLIIENALNQNRMLDGKGAYDLGLADALFDGADFLERSLDWAGAVVAGKIAVERARGRPRRGLGRGPGRGPGVRRPQGRRGLPRPVPGPGADGRRQDRRPDQRVRGGGRGARRADHGRRAAGEPVRLRPGPQAGRGSRRVRPTRAWPGR